MLNQNADQLERTDFTAYIDHEIVPGRNLIWCATMQLAWNELIDSCGGRLPDGERPTVRELNRRIVTRDDLDESSYVAMAGVIQKGVIQEIDKALETKFGGQASPEMLDEVEARFKEGALAYSYLFKNLAFRNHFSMSEQPLRFAGFDAQAFGFETHRKTKQQKAAAQVTIYDYKNTDDFVIEIKTESSGDRLILAKVHPDSTLHQTIAQVAHRLQTAGLPPGAESSMKIPILDFKLTKDYNELVGVFFCGVPIVMATQVIRFKLDETGAKLKSEAAIVTLGVVEASTSQLIFDKPFLVIMERQGLPHPYFALWVDNPELLVPFVTEKTEQ